MGCHTRILQIFMLSAVIIISDAQPTCTFYGDLQLTKCRPGHSDYILQKGLVSDNRYTTAISLRGCKLSGIGDAAFDRLPRLKFLDLSNNKIEILTPKDLGDGSLMTHLNLSHNLISVLPKGLFDHKSNLEFIDLKGNTLIEIDSTVFALLSRLVHLDLSNNQFRGKDFSEVIFPISSDITFIDFSGSDMTDTKESLLEALRVISILNLSECSLYEVPKFATRHNLRSMKHLMLINNVITSIDDPKTFANLENLEMLNFAGNSIINLNEDVFQPLKKLRTITLSGNKLKKLPDSLFTDLNKLTDIDLSHNLIETVPVNAFRGTSLRNLNLSKNRFTYLTSHFLVELVDSGANVRQFQFHDNPWQCACLRDLLKEAKTIGVNYIKKYDGKHKECVTTKEFTCKRQTSVNQMYIDMYFSNPLFTL